MRSFKKIVLLLALAALLPAQTFACAACSGKSDSPMAVGMNWGIFTLGAVIATVLGAFATFLIYAIRKSEAVEAAAQKKAAKPASV